MKTVPQSRPVKIQRIIFQRDLSFLLLIPNSCKRNGYYALKHDTLLDDFQVQFK